MVTGVLEPKLENANVLDELTWLWEAEVGALPRSVDDTEEDVLGKLPWLWDVAKVLGPKLENAKVFDWLAWL